MLRLPNSFLISLVLLVATISPGFFGQEFDEKFDLWPVDLKINGTVIAGGGGEMPAGAIELFLAAAQTEDSNPTVVRFDGPIGATEQEFEEEFKQLETLTQISISQDEFDLADKKINAIKESTAVWIIAQPRMGRTQTKVLAQVLDATTNVIRDGGIVCLNGPSVEWLGRFRSETTNHSASFHQAANLFPDTVIASEYVDLKQRSSLLSVLAANPQCVGIGIEKNTAVVLQHRKMRVIGGGQATFCLMANEHKPLRIQHVRQAESRRSSPYKTTIDLTAWRRDAIERTVEPFPPAETPKPRVENGTLFIVGGGGIPRGLVDEMVELAGGENAKMVYVPCTEDETVKGPHRMIQSWKKMGVKSAICIHTKDRIKANTDEQFLAPLKDATGIWFGGGRQWNFSDSYYGTKAHKMMKEVLARGGVIGGSSAGASIQAAYMCRANPVANFDIMAPGYERGLGFIRGVAIDQHFSQRGRQTDMTQLVNRYPQLLGIGIDEGTAIIVQKSQARVVGDAKVHFYDRNLPVVPGTDDFIALQAGAVFDLAKRKVIEKEIENDE